MADRTSAIVRYQTDILLRNLEQALDIVTEARLEKTISGGRSGSSTTICSTPSTSGSSTPLTTGSRRSTRQG